MAALPASGGVRSLLAKFENTNNNNSDASPSRGRSSGESNDNADNRPLSKVRASFVSVERNGQASPTPGMLRRTESYGTDVDPNQRSSTVSPTGQLEPSLASPFNPSPHKIRTALAAFQSDKIESVNEKLAALAVKDDVQPVTMTEIPKTKQEPSQPAIVEKPANKLTHSSSTKQSTAPKSLKKSASTMAISKESSANKTTPKGTTVKERKAAGTPTRSATTTTRSSAHPDKSAGPRVSAIKNTAPAARSNRASTPSQDAARKPIVQPSPKSKPASKSPTRPIRLPASLTTPTAASAARTGTLGRSQSHVNLRSSPKAEPAKTLSRKPSTLRPDVSRLAAHTIPDRPRSRVSTTSSRAPQEDSFLARMMRPTASSASKVHDKVEPRSPPRLAKPAKITPKKEYPAMVVENKNVEAENSVQDSVSTTEESKTEKLVVAEAAAMNGATEDHQEIERPATVTVEKDQTGAEAPSTAEPSSDTYVVEVAQEIPTATSTKTMVEESKLDATTDSADDHAAEEPKPEASTTSTDAPPAATEEPKPEMPTKPVDAAATEESISADSVEPPTDPATAETNPAGLGRQISEAGEKDQLPVQGLNSVPETVLEEPEESHQEPILEPKQLDDEDKQPSTMELPAESKATEENNVHQAEETAETDEAKVSKVEQSTEETTKNKDASENALFEAPADTSVVPKMETSAESDI